MARLAVNPTRMELGRLKAKLKTAQRGHKLLKDKRDDLMKKFLEMVRQNKEYREQVEEKMRAVYGGFAVAEAMMSPAALEEALMLPKYPVELKVGSVNMMSVTVPVFDFGDSARTAGDNYAYGLVSTCAELDDSVAALSGVLPMLLRLAQMEKAAQLLAGEIEKTRRRVNALEYVQIPSYEETIRYITMKLDENERSNLARLMKVKDMMLEDAHHYKSRRQASPE